MNKSEMVDALVAVPNVNLTKTQAQTIVGAIFDGETGLIATTLKGGGEVSVQGFGTFKVVERAARTGINPITKAKMDVPAKKAAKFKAGKNLLATVA